MINKRGFSIIEILTVVMISLIFLVVSFSGYREFTRRQDVTVAKRDIVADMRTAQKNAIIGNKPTGCAGTLVGYNFEVVENGPPAVYRVSGVCTDPGGGSDDEFVVKTVTTNGNISVTSPSVNPITFLVLNRGTNLKSGNSETLTITSRALGLSGVSGDQEITISWTGEIE